MNKHKISIIILLVLITVSLSSSLVNASIDFITSDTQHYIKVEDEGSEGSPIGFQDIIDYFEANPIPHDLQMPSSGDTCENNSGDWSIYSGDANAPTDENSIIQVGNYSINTTKNGAGGFSLKYVAPSAFGANCAEKIIFWVRVSNSDITLDSMTISQGYPVTYDNGGSGWNFSADTWTKVEIDPRNANSVPYRSYWTAITGGVFSFSGGVNGDDVYIDGFRLELENPNPTNSMENGYIFPVSLYLTHNYFSDDGFYFQSNILSGGWPEGSATPFYSYHDYQMNLGSELNGGMIFLNNFVCENDINGEFRIKYPVSSNIIGLTLNGNALHGGGMELSASSGDSILAKDLAIYRMDKFSLSQWGTGEMTIKNVVLGELYSPLWGLSGDIALDDITFYDSKVYTFDKPSVTLTNPKYVGYTGTNLMMYNKAVYRDRDYTYNLINPDFSESTGGELKNFGGAPWPLGNNATQNVQFTFNLKVMDIEGNKIENASVIITDKNEDEVVDVSTDENGEIVEQTITARYSQIQSDGTNHYTQWNPRDEGISLTPHKILISHENYLSKEFEFTLDKKINWAVYMEDSPKYNFIAITNNATKSLIIT